MSDSKSRRTFIKTSMASTALAIGLSCTRNQGTTIIPTFELEEITISELQKRMESGELTARLIVEKYLDRIERIDKSGPAINSIIELNPDALKVADKLDEERKQGKVRGPMHGIPVLIKDNIDTADKMKTSAGSLALANSIALKDALIVSKLRQSGAIILGKTNLSEWANFRGSRSTSGWSGRGGLTKNPYALDRNPCGSSSGSGAAVSANLCSIAIGTETNGSIVCPSNANGVVGIKPTVGLWSRSGIIPISFTQDTAGPMARCVADAATLLGALTGIDASDSKTKHSSGKSFLDYTQFLDPNGLQGACIGVARSYFGFNPKVDVLMENAISTIKKLGATVVDPANIENAHIMWKPSYQILLYEFKDGMNKYLSGLDANFPYKTLKDLIDFNKKNSEEELKYYGQEEFINAQEKGPLSEKEYLDALQKAGEFSQEKGIDATLRKQKLDAIIAPTGGPAWVTDLVNGDHYSGGSSSPAAISGYPNITVPAGFVFGLPVGISFFSTAWSEPKLIKYAYAFEQATKHRKPPRFLSKAKV